MSEVISSSIVGKVWDKFQLSLEESLRLVLDRDWVLVLSCC